MGRMGFTLTSPSWDETERIHPDHTYDGRNRPPAFEWSHVPDGARSLAMIVDDPDAPKGTFTHWVLWDVPPVSDTEDPTHLETLGGVAGKNDFQFVGYGGPRPPARDRDHRYRFRLFALDVESLEVPPGAARGDVERAMEGHVLGVAELTGRYRRQ